MRKYSIIYDKLTSGNNNELIGLIAYGIYKKQKIEYVRDFVASNGNEPTEDELERFHQFTLSPTQVQQYKSAAETSINVFLNSAMENKAVEVERFYKKTFKEIAKESGHGYWYGVGQGIVSSLIYTVLIGGLVLLLWSTQVGPKEVIERVFRMKMVPDTTAIPTNKK